MEKKKTGRIKKLIVKEIKTERVLSRINVVGKDWKRKELHLQEQTQVSYGYSFMWNGLARGAEEMHREESVRQAKVYWTYWGPGGDIEIFR